MEINDTLLKKFVRELSAGDHLIKEGDMGNTSYIVMEGSLLLFHKSRTAERLIGTAHAGELVGEQAVIFGAPHRRTYSAQAKESCVLLELDLDNWKMMQSKMPDLTTKTLKMLTQRLLRANDLISLLQAKDNAERVVQFIQYSVKHFGKKVADGMEMPLSAEDMSSILGVPADAVASALKTLTTEKILVPKGSLFILRDESALVGSMSHIKEQMAMTA